MHVMAYVGSHLRGQRDHRLCILTVEDSPSCNDGNNSNLFYTGGAITEFSAGRHLLVGIFSYGSTGLDGCRPNPKAAIFTRVDKYLRWIVATIQNGECLGVV